MRGLPDVAPELFAGVLCVLVIGAFFLGRWSVSTTVQAAEGTTSSTTEVVAPLSSADAGDQTPTMGDELPSHVTDSGPRTSAIVDPEPQPGLGGEALGSLSLLEQHTRDFMDTTNTVTLRVVYYNDDAEGRRMALNTTQYLAEWGFPVVTPIEAGGYVFVCVGAASSTSDPELLRIRRELRTLPGPPPNSKDGEFASTFVYNIDDLIQR